MYSILAMAETVAEEAAKPSKMYWWLAICCFPVLFGWIRCILINLVVFLIIGGILAIWCQYPSYNDAYVYLAIWPGMIGVVVPIIWIVGASGILNSIFK